MQNLLVLNRRSIAYRQGGPGELTVLMVPGADQIQVMKDLAGTVAPRLSDGEGAGGMMRRTPVSRVFGGQRVVYGYLTDDITQLRQTVRVWLPEDYAPDDAQAFFYVVNPQVVIHGVRETAEDSVLHWRTALLQLPGANPLAALGQALAEFVLANPGAVVTLAVHQDVALYQQLQTLAQPYGVAPVPLGNLKPRSGLKPLYLHRDHTIPLLASVLFGTLCVAGALAYAAVGLSARATLNDEITAIRQQIAAVQINQSIGHLLSPQQVLDAMERAAPFQLSAAIHAGAMAGNMFGQVRSLTWSKATEAPANQTLIRLSVGDLKDPLLLGQEQRAMQLLQRQPWLRLVQRTGGMGDVAMLDVHLQMVAAPEASNSFIDVAEDGAAMLPVGLVSPAAVASGTAHATTSPTQQPQAEGQP